MKLCRCPICHSDIHLDGLVEDEAGRELLGKISQLTHGVAKPMVAYLGLFRPAKSNLSNSRSLKIISEVLAMYDCSTLLAHCLSETVQAVRKKRVNGQNAEPLTNHNYLKSVYETQKTTFTVHPVKRAETSAQQIEVDKKRSAIEYIERWATLGQLDHVKHSPEYQIWLKWQEEKYGKTET